MRATLLVLSIACGAVTRNIVFERSPGGAVRLDQDGDGFAGAWVCPEGVSGCDADARNKQPIANLDCNDGNASIHPGAPDTPGDGIDSNCDGADGVVPKTVPDRLLGN
jgi:hypothetical protein